MSNKILLSKMTWPEVKERLKETDMVIIPIGSIEQHGPALPLNTDTYIAYMIAKKVAKKVAKDIKPVIAPPIYFGFSDHHMDFPGTISINEDTLANLIIDICKSLAKHGFRKIIILNGHGGNHAAIHRAMYELKRERNIFIAFVDIFNIVADIAKNIFQPPIYHADDYETSVVMALGQNVKKEKLVKEVAHTKIPKFIKIDFLAPPPSVKVPVYLKEFTESGIIGDPTKASKEKGEKIVEAIIKRLVDFLRELKQIKIENPP
ncbi:MAG: creatininase family protein [Candidatus Methanomethylicaceae archaeon]